MVGAGSSRAFAVIMTRDELVAQDERHGKVHVLHLCMYCMSMKPLILMATVV